MPTYQITIPDSVEWREETNSVPYRRVTAKLAIYTLDLDLVDADPDSDDVYLAWVPSIYNNIVDAEVYSSFDSDASWPSDDLETAKEEILEEALNLLHAYLVDDFGAVEISNDSIDIESGIDSLDLEN